MSNNQPFNIGERVVRVGPSNKYVKKGSYYTIADCIQCPHCGKWTVTLQEYPIGSDVISCGDCGLKISLVGYRGGRAEYFRSLETNRHSTAIVTATELLEVKEERGVDVVPQTIEQTVKLK